MSFSQITKYLDYIRGSRNTSRDKSRGKARSIKKLNYGFSLPSVVLTSTITKTHRYQVNFTMPGDFSIIKFERGSESIVRACVMCIRYRIGSTVYRYRLPISDDLTDDQTLDAAFPFRAIVAADKYNGEVIKSNFCIEYWGLISGTSNNASWTFTTSLLLNPSTPDDTSPHIHTSGAAYDRSALAVTLTDEPIPTTYNTAEQWLNN